MLQYYNARARVLLYPGGGGGGGGTPIQKGQGCSYTKGARPTF